MYFDSLSLQISSSFVFFWYDAILHVYKAWTNSVPGEQMFSPILFFMLPIMNKWIDFWFWSTGGLLLLQEIFSKYQNLPRLVALWVVAIPFSQRSSFPSSPRTPCVALKWCCRAAIFSKDAELTPTASTATGSRPSRGCRDVQRRYGQTPPPP